MPMLAAYKTPHELRAQVRAKLVPLLAKDEADARRLGLEALPITSEFVDDELPYVCIRIVMACDAFAVFLDDELERLDDEGEFPGQAAREIEEAQRDYAPEVASCNILVRQVLKEAKARGVSEDDLLSYVYFMMTPFTEGREPLTEVEWLQVRGENAREQAMHEWQWQQGLKKMHEPQPKEPGNVPAPEQGVLPLDP